MEEKLSCELVPRTCKTKNLRSLLRSSGWNRVRSDTYKVAGKRCEICGGVGKTEGSHKWPVEAHEVWEYDDIERVQRLVAVQALCPPCHRVKHLGRWMKRTNHRVLLMRHMMEINEWDEERLREYLRHQFFVYEMRSVGPLWTLDLSWLWAVYGDDADAMVGDMGGDA